MSWIDYVYGCLSDKASGDCNSFGVLAGPDGTVWAEHGVGAGAAADGKAFAALNAAMFDGSWGGQSFKLTTGKFMIVSVEDVPGTKAKIARASRMGAPAAGAAGAALTTVVSVAYTGKSILAGYNCEVGSVAAVNSSKGVSKGITTLAGLGY